MNVIAINGSPHLNGTTGTALGIMTQTLTGHGINVENIHVGAMRLHGCIGCGHCKKTEESLCVFTDDAVNEIALKMRDADGIIFAAPTYYAAIPGTMKCFLDRAVYSNSKFFRHKVGSALAVTRRAGAVETFQQLMNYLLLSEMVIAPTHYWNIGSGTVNDQVLQDAEGIPTIQQSAENMAWLIKALAESKIQPPAQPEKRQRTNFIR